ncbi:MAG: hypothetical protein CL774_02525 [Chloroflexi bacterium]|nr:hypothetical protein [Chloroflexota bacterium]
MDSRESILLDGIYVTSVGMLTVFFILILIFISIKIVIYLTTTNKKNINIDSENNEIIRIPDQKVNISESQIAAIAVAYMLKGNNEDFNDIDTNKISNKNSSTWWSNGNQRSLGQPTTQYIR